VGLLWGARRPAGPPRVHLPYSANPALTASE
jgi:hypothetical protein